MSPRPLRRLPVLTDAVVSCVDYCRLFATMINTDVVAKRFKEVKFGDNRPCIGGEEGAEMLVLHMPRSLFEKQVRLAEDYVLSWKMHKGEFRLARRIALRCLGCCSKIVSAGNPATFVGNLITCSMKWNVISRSFD